MNRALLDTDVFSEILKKKNPSISGRARAYRAHHGRFSLSVATVMEIVRGLCRLDAHRQLQLLLGSLDETEILPIDRDIATVAGRIDGALAKAGRRIGVADVLIAATAIQHNLPLFTGNFEHYERIRQSGYPLELESWRDTGT